MEIWKNEKFGKMEFWKMKMWKIKIWKNENLEK